MDKTYNHQGIEEKWYKFWEESGFFIPKKDPKKKPFCIIMPPPNANGSLHIGHALFITIQDILIRYHRMKGEPTLWLPGADHAGILTQVVFEKELAKKGKTRFDLGREEFYRQCYEFSQKNKTYMYQQLKRLGASCDWTREKFTLDPEIEKIVMQTFKKLYDDGLIYKGERIINWCPRCSTALSDLEVVYKEKQSQLYFLDYGPLAIATTRPETIFADVAVAVNPKDKRYQNLIGKKALVPLINKEVPIIADSAVEQNFGTGALKITPGHDPKDWEIGQRHNLPTILVIDSFGKMINVPKILEGKSANEAKNLTLAELKKEKKLIKIQEYKHSVGTCERCGTTIEPLVSNQWFIKISSKLKVKSSKLKKELGVEEASLADLGILTVKKGLIKIIPRRFEKIYFQWMENLKDWCISRQIWWGYKIPIKGEEDTLDTWFSSGQWPFATLMASPHRGDFEYFYPTTVMETGYEILFFWVARMIMLGLYITGQVPFRTVYLHGLVRDAFGQKMSKSKGNVIDPLEVADKYGADAVRFALIWGTAPGHDQNLGEEKIRGMRNFTNKIWNIGRFILLNLQDKKLINFKDKSLKENQKIKDKDFSSLKPSLFLMTTASGIREDDLSHEDKQILEKLNHLVKKTTQDLDNFRLSQAALGIYEFLWHEFADKYLENSKSKLQNLNTSNKDKLITFSILYHVYLTCLKLLHPFMPFITEEIYQKLPKKDKSIMISLWPRVN